MNLKRIEQVEQNRQKFEQFKNHRTTTGDDPQVVIHIKLGGMDAPAEVSKRAEIMITANIDQIIASAETIIDQSENEAYQNAAPIINALKDRLDNPR